MQFGCVFGYCSKDHYSNDLIESLEDQSKKDLSEHVDMVVGCYISVHCGKYLEEIKKSHFFNGYVYNRFFESNKRVCLHRIMDGSGLSGSYFFIVERNSNEHQAAAHQFRYRDSFAHFHTSLINIGNLCRISPASLDLLDCLIEVAEFYLSSYFSKNDLILLLNELDTVDYLKLTLSDKILSISVLMSLNKKITKGLSVYDDICFLIGLKKISLYEKLIGERQSIHILKKSLCENINFIKVIGLAGDLYLNRVLSSPMLYEENFRIITRLELFEVEHFKWLVDNPEKFRKHYNLLCDIKCNHKKYVELLMNDPQQFESKCALLVDMGLSHVIFLKFMLDFPEKFENIYASLNFSMEQVKDFLDRIKGKFSETKYTREDMDGKIKLFMTEFYNSYFLHYMRSDLSLDIDKQLKLCHDKIFGISLYSIKSSFISLFENKAKKQSSQSQSSGYARRFP